MVRTLTSLLLVLVLAGCQSRLKDNRTIDVEAGGINTIRIDGPKYEQKVQIEFTSTNVPVSVYVCLRKDETMVGGAAEVDQLHATALCRTPKGTTGSVEVTVPAKQEFSVMVIGGNKPTSVKLKIVGK